MRLKFKAKLDDDGKVDCLVVPTGGNLGLHVGTVDEDSTYVNYTCIYEWEEETRLTAGHSVVARLWNQWPTVEVEVPEDLDDTYLIPDRPGGEE